MCKLYRCKTRFSIVGVYAEEVIGRNVKHRTKLFYSFYIGLGSALLVACVSVRRHVELNIHVALRHITILSVGDGGQRGLGSAVAVEHPNMDYMEAFLKDDVKTARMVGKYNKLNAVYKRIAWLWDVFILVIIGLAVVLSQGTDFLNTFAGSMLLIGVLLALLLGFRFIYNRSVEFVYSLRCAKWIKKNGYDVSQYIIDKFNETEANLE